MSRAFSRKNAEKILMILIKTIFVFEMACEAF